jgi:hypothetical protein
MSSVKICLAVLLAGAVTVWAAGCTSSTSTTTSTAKTDDHGHEDHGHEGHDHAHDHPAHGPNGGHILETDTKGYHFEWTHNEEGLVTVYALDESTTKALPIAASEVTIDVKIADNKQSFTLPAADASEGKATKFEVTDKELLGVLEALDGKSENVTATLIANIEGAAKPVTAKFEAHDHDHGHEHKH